MDTICSRFWWKKAARASAGTVFLGRMTGQKIGVGVHYLALPEHPFYQERFGWNADDYPYARDIGRQTVSLPLSAKLSDKDVEDVIRAVRGILE